MQEPFLQSLDRLGIPWVKQCLEDGEVFSRIVLSKLNLEEGKVFLAVATTEHQSAVAESRRLDRGVTTNKIVHTDVQAELLLKKLRTFGVADSLVVVVEDNLRYPGDHVLSKFPTDELLQVDDRILHVKKISAFKDPTDFRSYLHLSSGYPLDAFVIAESFVSVGQHISDAVAQKVAPHVIAIINSAYDGESYTLWIRNTVFDQKPQFR